MNIDDRNEPGEHSFPSHSSIHIVLCTSVSIMQYYVQVSPQYLHDYSSQTDHFTPLQNDHDNQWYPPPHAGYHLFDRWSQFINLFF